MYKSEQMIIEIRGVNFINKGAELMLLAIISKIKWEIPGAIFVLEKTTDSPRNKHIQYGIYTKTNFNFLSIPLKYFFSVIPVFLLRRWRFIKESEVNIILDASGFAFSDIWGVNKASGRLGNNIQKWKRQNKKVILMPQAFGPFNDNKLAAVMKTIISNADMVFARDRISFKYLNQLQVHNAKIEIAPDFTNNIKGTLPLYFNSAEFEVAIVVNSKMIEATEKIIGDAYINLIYRIIIITKNLGYKPYFLLHEVNTDKNLVEVINSKLQNKLPVIKEDDPLHIKGMIESSKGVIASRYHALVSCLWQAVPCLAIGWSHKYEMLLKDYNYQEGLLNVDCDDATLYVKIESILLDPSRKIIIEKLKLESVSQQQRSDKMWQQVFNVIKEKEKVLNLKTASIQNTLLAKAR